MTELIELIDLVRGVPSLVACFSARTGGVSPAPFASLNLGFSTGDAPDNVRENRRRFAAEADVPLERWIVSAQVHGADLLVAERGLAGRGSLAPTGGALAADAVFLPEPGIFALSLSADCPLVVLADPTARRAGIAHAGWRGTAAGVVEELLEAFRAAGSHPADLVAGISPGICGGCYPVGDEVRAAFASHAGFAEAVAGDHLDLRRLQRRVLLDAGVAAGAIAVHSGCSSCDGARFFSHRRDRGQTGRSGALVGWRE